MVLENGLDIYAEGVFIERIMQAIENDTHGMYNYLIFNNLKLTNFRSTPKFSSVSWSIPIFYKDIKKALVLHFQEKKKFLKA